MGELAEFKNFLWTPEKKALSNQKELFVVPFHFPQAYTLLFFLLANEGCYKRPVFKECSLSTDWQPGKNKDLAACSHSSVFI